MVESNILLMKLKTNITSTFAWRDGAIVAIYLPRALSLPMVKYYKKNNAEEEEENNKKTVNCFSSCFDSFRCGKLFISPILIGAVPDGMRQCALALYIEIKQERKNMNSNNNKLYLILIIPLIQNQ